MIPSGQPLRLSYCYLSLLGFPSNGLRLEGVFAWSGSAWKMSTTAIRLSLCRAPALATDPRVAHPILQACQSSIHPSRPAGPQLRSACHPSQLRSACHPSGPRVTHPAVGPPSPACSPSPRKNPKPYCLGEKGGATFLAKGTVKDRSVSTRDMAQDWGG